MRFSACDFSTCKLATSHSVSSRHSPGFRRLSLIGPMLVGLTHSVQICQLGAKDSDIVNLAALAAYDING